MISAAEDASLERSARRRVLLRYLLALTAMSLVWEFAQMPLYTIGQVGMPAEIAYAVVHCTLGDAMIGSAALLIALFLVGPGDWPRERRLRVLSISMAIGLGYTVFSEWLNVEVRGTWSYSTLMPIVPPIGTGLSPLLQWMILPPLAYAAATVGAGRVELSKPSVERGQT